METHAAHANSPAILYNKQDKTSDRKYEFASALATQIQFPLKAFRIIPTRKAVHLHQKHIRQLAGSGGEWVVYDEREDPSVVTQLGPTHCCVACIEMILRDRGIPFSQQKAAERIGVPTWPDLLPKLLNKLDPEFIWDHGFVPTGFHHLNQRAPWIALFKDVDNDLLHAVIVDGEEDGHLRIRDPWPPGTTYIMTPEDFQTDHHGWTGMAVFIKRQRPQTKKRTPRRPKSI